MIKKLVFVSAVALASLGAAAFELSSKSSATCPLEGTLNCPKVTCPLKGTPQCPLDQSSLPECCKAKNPSQTVSLLN